MRTAVQLRDARPHCTLLCGAPTRIVSTSRGPVAVFASREVVAYLLEAGPTPRLFLFRTLERDERGAAMVPGIRPKVRLLLALHTSGRIQLLRRLFAYLARNGWSPSLLSDAFWLRVSHVIGGRLPQHRVVVKLLASEKGARMLPTTASSMGPS